MATFVSIIIMMVLLVGICAAIAGITIVILTTIDWYERNKRD